MSFLKQNIFLGFCIITVCLLSLFNFNSNRIKIDAPSYYMYLPSVLIHNDLSLKYLDTNKERYKELTWYNTTKDGKRIIKHTCGVSLLMLPFFLIACTINNLFNIGTEYSLLFQNIMHTGVLLYFFIGLYSLRRTLTT